MRQVFISLASAVVCFFVASPVLAQDHAEEMKAYPAVAPEETSSGTVNRDLLDALIKRRAEVAGSGSSEGTNEAVRFLDAQIGEMTDRVMLDALVKRRMSAAQSGNQDATTFLDTQIAKVRSRVRD